jgi:hypothetical protein
VLCHEAMGGNHASRAVLMDLEPGVIGAVTQVAARRALPPGKPRDPKRGRGQQLGQGPLLQKGWERILLTPLPCSVAAFEWPRAKSPAICDTRRAPHPHRGTSLGSCA